MFKKLGKICNYVTTKNLLIADVGTGQLTVEVEKNRIKQWQSCVGSKQHDTHIPVARSHSKQML